MNKVMIGLLIVAAGVGVFYFIRKDKHASTTAELKKEWLVGKWKAQTTVVEDSNFNKINFDVREDGKIILTYPNDPSSDTAFYMLSKDSTFSWKKTEIDTVQQQFQVLQLTQDSVQLKSKENETVLFIKTK